MAGLSGLLKRRRAVQVRRQRRKEALEDRELRRLRRAAQERRLRRAEALGAKRLRKLRSAAQVRRERRAEALEKKCQDPRQGRRAQVRHQR